MATNKLQWKRIAMGDKLPCQSFLRKKDGEILKLSTIGGVTVGQDCYYLPVDEVINVIKDYPIEESEDERTINNIKKVIGWHRSMFTEKSLMPEQYQEIDAWLDKKGERKHQYKSRPRYVGEENLLGKKISNQKPADKVEQKFKVGDVIRLKGSAAEYTIKKVTDTTYYTNGWSCGIERCEEDYELVEQKHAEWSEEDENLLKLSLENLAELKDRFGEEYGKVGDCIVWHESLKDRIQHQPTWKPSEEQLIALKCAITTADEKWVCMNTKDLESLYEQLKKLREE